MGRRVFKYQFSQGIHQAFEMPRGAEVLTAQVQHGVVCLWARVDTRMPMELRRFVIIGTGHDGADGKYVGTVQMDGGDFVFHVFEVAR